jgi:hypothetical protein
MRRRISLGSPGSPAPLRSAELAYAVQPMQRNKPKKHRSAQKDGRNQSRNVNWNQGDGGMFRKVMEGRRKVSRGAGLFEFHKLLINRHVRHCIGNICKPTTPERPETAFFQTPTTQNAFLNRISNIREACRLGTKPESPLASTNGFEILERNPEKCRGRNVFWNQQDGQNGASAKMPNRAPMRNANVV